MKKCIKALLCCFTLTSLLSGCLATKNTFDWPKASPEADQVLNLESNVERTDFVIDGVKIATGRRMKVLVDNGSHTVRAEPPGYTPKEEYIQPPYHSYSSLSFIFMLGDKLDAVRLGEPAITRAVAPMANPGFKIPYRLLKTDKTNNNAIAVIIGNRNYRVNSQDVPDVNFAHNDADLVYQYVTESLGFREGNIILLKDATQAQLMSTFGTKDQPKGKLANWVRPGLTDVFVFYSGHGVPGLKDGQGYLLPVDADPSTVEINGYPLETLYKNLAQLPVRNLTIAVDACFSGLSNDGAVVKNASSISLKVAKPKVKLDNATVITAAGFSEVASWDKDARLGLLTRHMVEGLSGQADKTGSGNGDGRVTVAELNTYLSEEVSYQARRQYGREQNPEVKGMQETVISTIK